MKVSTTPYGKATLTWLGEIFEEYKFEIMKIRQDKEKTNENRFP
ncbi:Uncharacterised protein [Streptococcus pneumoniae]|nr:Uncharacterised protein [Streptococcus pneumoniae]